MPLPEIHPTEVVPGNALFVRNMRLLWRHDPQLALRLDAVADHERFPLEPTRSEAWTARITTADGKSVYLHSRHDPADEARQWASAVEIEDKYCIVVSGAGLGHHLKELFARLKGDAFMVCIEPSLRLLATALACVDLTPLLASGRFVILTDADKSRLHGHLHPHSSLMLLGTQFAHHAPSRRLDPAAHDAIQQAVGEFIAFARMSLMTLVGNSLITCRNVAMNLVTYARTPPIDLLCQRFAGDPAIVISAGPSLSKSMDQLASLKGRAVLCAVQTALRPLMERGIVPDFVTSLDFHEMSRKYFEDVGDLSRTHLVAEPKAAHPVIDAYPGPVSLLGNDWARLVLGDELGARGGLAAGATVAHLAFYLAVYLGCDPIIFVGQDLAFTGHVFYVPGVEIHRAWRSELNRFHTMEHLEWERIARNRPILRRVTGNDGSMLYSDELLFTYLEQFEKDVAAVDRRIINATEGGARIRGAAAMSLAETVERFCGREIEPDRFAYREATCWRNDSHLPAALGEVNARRAELEEAEGVCEELLRLLDELSGLIHDPPKFNHTLIRVDELRTRVHHDTRPYRIVNAASQLAEFRRYTADRRINAAAETDGADRARRQIARDVEFITGVRDGAREVKVILSEAADRLRHPPRLGIEAPAPGCGETAG
ncbi:MAG: 6-hydroxymethylpterin diphosphokinase MptE-like protein [Planctomycetota bacterium]